MNIVILYDSQFGNTEKVAQAIAQGMNDSKNVMILHCEQASMDDFKDIKTLVVGSPTQGGRATDHLQALIHSLPDKYLKGISHAAFDTRFAEKDHGLGLKLLMRTIGYAAPKLSTLLTSKGSKVLHKPEGFYVKDKQGPLNTGELERAKKWGKDLARLS